MKLEFEKLSKPKVLTMTFFTPNQIRHLVDQYLCNPENPNKMKNNSDTKQKFFIYLVYLRHHFAMSAMAIMFGFENKGSISRIIDEVNQAIFFFSKQYCEYEDIEGIKYEMTSRYSQLRYWKGDYRPLLFVLDGK